MPTDGAPAYPELGARRGGRAIAPRIAERIAVMGALWFALGVRLHLLGEANLWWDEALAVWAVRKGLAGVTLWTASDVHPPAFFWALWGWTAGAGESELAARTLSALVGVAVVAAAYALARHVGGPRAGLLAAVLAAASRLLVWWSMELRMYVLAGLFVTAALVAAGHWMRRRDLGARADAQLAAYVASALGAVLTVYLSWVAVLGINLGVAPWLWRRPGAARRWLGAQAVLLALYVPWLALALPRMSSWSSLREPVPLAFVAQLWAVLLAVGESTDIAAARVPAALFVGLFVAGGAAVALRRPPLAPGGRVRSRAAVAIGLLALTVLPPLAVWAATQPRSLFYTPSVEARYLVPFAPAAIGLAALAAEALWRAWRPAGALAAAGLVTLALLSLPAHYAERRWQNRLQAMATTLWQEAAPGDLVLLVSGDRYPLFRYAYDRRPSPGLGGDGSQACPTGPCGPAAGAPADRPALVAFPEAGGGVIDPGSALPRLERMARGYDRIWLVELESHLQDPEGRVEAWLADRLPRRMSEAYGPDALHLFGTEASAAPRPYALPLPRRAAAGDEVEVLAVAPGPRSGAERLRARAELRPLEDPGAPAALTAVGHGPGRVRLPLRIERVPRGRYQVLLGLAGGADASTEPWGTLSVINGLPAAPRRDVGAGVGPLRLEEAGWTEGPWSPGDEVAVDLVWGLADSNAPVPEDAVVFVHLLGPARPDGGTVWAGSDAPPSGGAWALAPDGLFDRHLLRLPPTMPPGAYELELGIYPAGSLERLPVAGPTADVAADRLVLGSPEVRAAP